MKSFFRIIVMKKWPKKEALCKSVVCLRKVFLKIRKYKILSHNSPWYCGIFRLWSHSHVIFTIDEGLRDVFLLHSHLLKDLMDAAAKLIIEFFQKKSKLTPGIIAGLHTFGSRVNFNPHVHMLVTMNGLTDKGEWKQYDFLPFAMLRKQWQTVVLKLIRKGLSDREKISIKTSKGV
jgi:hypothetical protein